MFPPFPTERARKICRKMLEELDSGKIKLTASNRTSTERKDQGIMLGAMLCRDSDGNEIELRTVSGLSKTIIPESQDKRTVYVEPIVPPQRIDEALLPNDREIHEYTDEINSLLELTNRTEEQESRLDELKKARTELTTESLKKVFSLYSFRCIDGSTITLNEICRRKNIELVPTGTGECCAPKLLNHAFSHNMQVLSMSEVYYGKDTPHKQNAHEYPPCDERCGIILPFMLGLEIIWRDKDICVINKPSGLLSIPGRGEEKQDCVSTRLRRLFPECIEQPSVHRLDMETSGLMVYAFTEEAHRNLSRQFENGIVKKEYTALLDGILPKKGIKEKGCMELYFRLDVENRPHQIWDSINGKKAVTEWQIINVEPYTAPDGKQKNVTRVRFIPHTGRTHQLRLASADSHGFGTPIIGDSLYGKPIGDERLMLHASSLSFVHPISGLPMSFKSVAPF
ncbi:MAG: RluA family pseudouridine synthase [Treponema sp.]|nr:RluA family pseudouridine synthase [Treponema sp.]